MPPQGCLETTWHIPAVLFFAGAFLVALRLKRQHRLSLRDTMQAMLGAKQVKRDRTSNILMLATLFAPIALWLYLGRDCGI